MYQSDFNCIHLHLQELKSAFDRLIVMCRLRSEGDDTGDYLGILSTFEELLLQVPSKIDPDFQHAAAALLLKCELLLVAAKENADQVRRPLVHTTLPCVNPYLHRWFYPSVSRYLS